MDYEEINDHMTGQQKASLRAALLQQMAGSDMTYDEINNCLSEQQKTSLMTAALQTMVADISGAPQEYTNYDDVNNQLSEQQKSSLMASALLYLKDNQPSGGFGIPLEISDGGVLSRPASYSFVVPENATSAAGDYVLSYAFDHSYGLTAIDLSPITSVSGTYSFSNMCSNCRYLKTADLPEIKNVNKNYTFSGAFSNCSTLKTVVWNIEEISGSYACQTMFNTCVALTSIDMSSLKTVSGSNACTNMFQTGGLSSGIDLSGLTSITGNSGCKSMFNASQLKTITFTSLSVLTASYALQQAFSSCRSLTSVSFPALTASSFGSNTNQFNKMLQSVTGCTVHFPAAIQSTIGNWSDVTAGFGGTNTTVLFDL